MIAKGVRKNLDLMRGVYENNINCKFTAKGGGVYEKIPDFDEFWPIPHLGY